MGFKIPSTQTIPEFHEIMALSANSSCERDLCPQQRLLGSAGGRSQGPSPGALMSLGTGGIELELCSRLWLRSRYELSDQQRLLRSLPTQLPGKSLVISSYKKNPKTTSMAVNCGDFSQLLGLAAGKGLSGAPTQTHWCCRVSSCQVGVWKDRALVCWRSQPCYSSCLSQ